MLKRLGVFTAVIMAVVLTVIGLSAAAPQSTPITAQSTLVPLPTASDGSTPQPVLPTSPQSEAGIPPVIQQEMDEYLALLDTADTCRYWVGYFASPSGSFVNTLATTKSITDTLHVEVMYSWGEVINAYAIQPFPILMLDETTYRLVDQSWVQQEFIYGLVVTGINVPAPAMSEMVGERCEPTAETHRFPSDYYSIYYFALKPIRESDRQTIARAELQICRGDEYKQAERLGYSLRQAMGAVPFDTDNQESVAAYEKTLAQAALTVQLLEEKGK
jgi:hypothetical protein